MLVNHALKYFKNKKKLTQFLEVHEKSVFRWKGKLSISHSSRIKEKIESGELTLYPPLKKYGKHALSLGYNVIPLLYATKGCVLSSWTSFETKIKDIDYWVSQEKYKLGGFAVTTKNCPAVDIDLYNPKHVEQVKQFCEKQFGSTIQRIGQAPKTLLVYQSTEEITRQISTVFTDAEGRKNRVEVLGKGQNYVAYSIHEKTKKPYEWIGDAELLTIKRKSLPFLTVSKVEMLIKFVNHLIENEWDHKSIKSSPKRKKIENLKSKINITDKELKEALKKIDSEDYDTWIKIGMALHHQYEEKIEGLDIWNEWSSTAKNYAANEIEGKWYSFQKSSGEIKPITVATILNWNKENKDWEKELRSKKDKFGGFLSYDKGVFNLSLIITNHELYKDKFYYDELKQRVCIIGSTKNLGNGKDTRFQDLSIIDIKQKISYDYGLEHSNDNIDYSVQLVASKNSIHPVKNYLEKLPSWDMVERLPYLWIKYLGVKDDIYTRETAEAFGVAMVKRIYEPGCKFDYMPIISGTSGLMKSTFVKELAVKKEWFGDNLLTFGGKEAVEAMEGRWLVEIPELLAFGESGVRKAKAFMSRVDDSVRKAYGRRVTTLLRQTLFIGTDEHERHIEDGATNRRFWPLACTVLEIDIAGFKLSVPLLMAEMLHKYRKGNLVYLSSGAEEIAKIYREKATVDSGWPGMIEAWLNKPFIVELKSGDRVEQLNDATCIQEIKENCLSLDLKNKPPNHMSKKIADILSGIKGWESSRERKQYKQYGRQYLYIRSKKE